MKNRFLGLSVRLLLLIGLGFSEATCSDLALRQIETSSADTRAAGLSGVFATTPKLDASGNSIEVLRKRLTAVDVVAVGNAINRYMEVTGKVPRSFDNLVKEGYLFFMPMVKPISWEATDDYVRFKIESHTLATDDPNDFKVTEITIYHPKSEVALERERKRRELDWKLHELDMKGSYGHGGPPPNSPWRKLTREDFISGRVSTRVLDSLREYSANEKEFAQILWARELTSLLQAYAAFYYPNHRHPLSAKELLDFIGPKIPAGWVAPLTGKTIDLKDQYDGENAAYIASEDGQKFEIIVPLFGAGGSRVPNIYMQLPTALGIHPGKYYRVYANDRNPMENVLLDYAWY